MLKKFVIHEHHATKLHYDVRLEIDDVLKSWALPKGPSMDSNIVRLAIATSDHNLKYLNFQGTRRAGLYGAGDVCIWDKGQYEGKLVSPKDAPNVEFLLIFFGSKIKGAFSLKSKDEKFDNWFFRKLDDEHNVPNWELKAILPERKFGAKFPLFDALDPSRPDSFQIYLAP